jgi:hypothetical protein
MLEWSEKKVESGRGFYDWQFVKAAQRTFMILGLELARESYE